MKKYAEHISVNTVRAIFLLHKLMAFHTQCQKLSRFFYHTATLNIFGNTSEGVLNLGY